MAIHVTWLEEVKAIRFSVSYRALLGHDDPEALAANVLLKANIAEMGLAIAPKLSIKGSTPYSFFMKSFESVEFSHLVRAKCFTSIEDIKGVLRGFNEHISTKPYPTYGGANEYTFEEDTYEKLIAYFSAQSATNDADVIEGPCELFPLP